MLGLLIAAGREQWADLTTLSKDADAIIHVAGINRASDTDVGLSEQSESQVAMAVLRGVGSNSNKQLQSVNTNME